MHVLIYSIPVCPWCDAAKDFFSKNSIPYDEIILETKEDKDAFKTKSGMKTVPAIYVDGNLVGGYSEMITQLKEGKLVLNYR